jgi:hypothetical protein
LANAGPLRPKAIRSTRRSGSSNVPLAPRRGESSSTGSTAASGPRPCGCGAGPGYADRLAVRVHGSPARYSQRVAAARIPPALIGVVADVLAEFHTHSQMSGLFLSAGLDPEHGEQQGGMTKVERVHRALASANTAHPEPLAVLGTMLANLFENRLEPGDEKGKKVRRALGAAGLTYQLGHIVPAAQVGAATKTVEELLAEHDLPAIEREFQRALQDIETRPDSAVTSACAILESFLKHVLDDAGIGPPKDKSIIPLWKAAKPVFALTDEDIVKMVGALASVIHAVADLRTHRGSAHGRAPNANDLTPDEARLATGAAHTVLAFLMAVWKLLKRGGLPL